MTSPQQPPPGGGGAAARKSAGKAPTVKAAVAPTPAVAGTPAKSALSPTPAAAGAANKSALAATPAGAVAAGTKSLVQAIPTPAQLQPGAKSPPSSPTSSPISSPPQDKKSTSVKVAKSGKTSLTGAKQGGKAVPPPDKPPPVEKATDQFQEGDVVAKNFRLGRMLGKGGFGVVHETTDLRTNQVHAIKLELRQPRPDEPGLSLETGVLKRLQTNPHFARFVESGRHGQVSYLVMQLVGKNLGELRKTCPERRFTSSTSIRLATQAFEAIEGMHHAGFLHRDIKPANFCIGAKAPESRTVYLLDFGLVRRFRLKNGQLRPPRPRTAFRGTPKYASANSNNNLEVGRHDDLISWMYMFIEFVKSELPWQNEPDRLKATLMKMTAKNQMFTGTLPDMLMIYNSLAAMKYHDEPPYAWYKQCLNDMAQKHKVNAKDPFDWEPGGTFHEIFRTKTTQPLVPSPGEKRPEAHMEKRQMEDQSKFTTEVTETEATSL